MHTPNHGVTMSQLPAAKTVLSVFMAIALAVSLTPMPAQQAYAFDPDSIPGYGPGDTSEFPEDHIDRGVTSGLWGTCPWTYDKQTGIVVVKPGVAERMQDYCAAPWSGNASSEYAFNDFLLDVKKVVFEKSGNGYVVLPENCAGLFYWNYGLEEIDFTGADTTKVKNWENAYTMDLSYDGYYDAGISKLTFGDKFGYAAGVERPQFSHIIGSEDITGVWYQESAPDVRILNDEFWAKYDTIGAHGTWLRKEVSDLNYFLDIRCYDDLEANWPYDKSTRLDTATLMYTGSTLSLPAPFTPNRVRIDSVTDLSGKAVANNAIINPGKYIVSVSGVGEYAGSARVGVNVVGATSTGGKPSSGSSGSAANGGSTSWATKAFAASVTKSKVTLSAKKLKKKAQKVATVKTTNATGKVTYKNVSSKAKAKKQFTVSSKGVIKAKKKTGKGTYAVKIKATCGKVSKNVAVKVTVK